MPDFEIIPVLDLMGGRVVHGKAGLRKSYRPIESPFGSADRPLDIARGLIEAAGASIRYIADLDAIEKRGDHGSHVAELREGLPGIEIWLDAGFADVAAAQNWRKWGITPVIGSESLAALDQWQVLASEPGLDPVLSLDFDGDAFRGPAALLAEPALWPARIIVMTLARVGSSAGPDVASLKTLRAAGGQERRYYAAGGVRHAEDLERLAKAGAAGVAIATALHRGLMTEKEIAAFRRRRRLPI